MAEQSAIQVWNTVYGELRLSDVVAAAEYHGVDDFESLQVLLAAIRDEQSRKD